MVVLLMVLTTAPLGLAMEWPAGVTIPVLGRYFRMLPVLHQIDKESFGRIGAVSSRS